jgi:hypothetical protein
MPINWYLRDKLSKDFETLIVPENVWDLSQNV